jgi:hypothetical protein
MCTDWMHALRGIECILARREYLEQFEQSLLLVVLCSQHVGERREQLEEIGELRFEAVQLLSQEVIIVVRHRHSY